MTMLEHIEKLTYWMTDSDWYDYDEQDKPYMTELAPPEAVESFKYNREVNRKLEAGEMHCY